MEEQLKIATELIADLKKKVADAEGAKNVAEWAREEALRGKAEADFGRVEAQASKEEAEEAAYAARVAETEAALRAQVPGVCRLYCSQVWSEALKQTGVEASFDLWKAENVYYPFAICEAAPSNSEAEVAVEGTDTATNEEAEEAAVPT